MTMNKVIFTTLFTVIVFTGVVLYYNYHGIQVQDGLITAFFALFGTELTAMGGIKITKVVKERKNLVNSIRRGTVNHGRRYEAWDRHEDED